VTAVIPFTASHLDAAVTYAQRGWRVFPLAPKSKVPLVPKTSGGNGCHDGTTDLTKVRAWWTEHPNAGIGLHCGPGSGVVVLDVDAGKGGPEALQRLESAFGALPQTLISSTGGGGRHYFFRAPVGREIKNRVALKGPNGARILGLDVRSEGGYVVLPPSDHPSGGSYRWAFDDDLADMPAWLLDLLDPPKNAAPSSPSSSAPSSALILPLVDQTDRDRRYVAKALQSACDNIRTTPEGGRNDTVNSEAYSIGGWLPTGLLERTTAEVHLIDAALACGLDASEARSVVMRALDAGSQNPRRIPGHLGLATIYEVAKQAQGDRKAAKVSAVRLMSEELADDLATAARHRPHELDEALGFLAAVEGFGATAEKVGKKAASRAKEQADADAAARQAQADHAPDPDAVDPNDPRPQIVVSSAEADLVFKATAILAAKASELFVRGGALVRVRVDEHLRATIESCPEPEIRRLLSREIRWVRMRRDPTGAPVLTKTSPPQHVSKQIAALPEYVGFRALAGVSSSPLLRPDGTIAAESGYDAPSRWLLRIPESLGVDVPLAPDKDVHVAPALYLLENLLQDFPFEKPHHRAAALAYLLTLVARTYFDGPAPLFLVTGSAAGSGKGLLLDILTDIAFGFYPDKLSHSADEEEARKRITSILGIGARAVIFDNIPNGAKLGNAILDSLMTSTEWTDRPLGSTAILRLPALATWGANGNNIGVRGDMVRRAIPIRLEPQEDNPEARTDFKIKQIRRYVKERRAELLTAALTILSGWVAANSPDVGVPVLGSFEAWSCVRQALVWAGSPDPCDGMAEFRELSDEKAEDLEAILDGFNRIWGAKGRATSIQVAQRFSTPLSDDDSRNPLCVLIRARCMGGREVNAQKVGNFLGQYRRTWRGGKAIDKKKSGGTWYWHLVVKGQEPAAFQDDEEGSEA
jgi:hypothetical protein